MRRALVLAALLCGGVLRAQTPAAPTVRIDDAGPGIGPELLARELSRPHTVVGPASNRYVVMRGTDLRQTLVVLGRDAVIEGSVQGDVVVVGGDLYMHPGGRISGRATAFGGGVYESALATIGGEVSHFQDFTYDVTPIPGGFALRYRPLVVADNPTLSWSGIYGITLPTYDRTDGLSIGVGPRYRVPGTSVSVIPRITYRSQLGAWDPSVVAQAAIDRRTTLDVWAGRTTASNDRWIQSDLVNSLVFFANGDDARNYYRATGGDARLSRAWETVSGTFTPYVGARYERASSVRPGLLATGGPWTILGRNDDERDDRLRINPVIDDGAIASGLVGFGWDFADAGVVARLKTDGEIAGKFQQATIDGRIEFPTFGTQHMRVDAHVVTSLGATPRQRYAYIGGPGTLATLELLTEGGDQLAFFDARYMIPIEGIQLPFLGAPMVTLHEALGGARVDHFPTLHQLMGLRLSAGPAYVEGNLDPVIGKTTVGIGFSFAR